ncbi:glycosyltransferase [Thiocystis violacea]|uniref:glycosyltransferase n=1 Tax=Thiocystis violacea TaxID=13725 RepID=UPI001F5BE276|nr:glycosyltransferase [Thiocystis violacea]
MPGGENGGARIFILELLEHLAEIAPGTRFILLTQAASHDELARLERPNMHRRMVVGALVGNALRPRLARLAGRLLPFVPARPRRALSDLAYQVNARLKRLGSKGLLGELGVDLLFCPFTAPTYWEPGLPTLCTLYDLQYLAFPDFFSPEDRALRARTFEEICRRASLVVAISDHARATAIDQGRLDPARIRVVHLRMARRLSAWIGQESGILERLGLVSGRYLIYPANFWPHKNHGRLLAAFRMAREAGLSDGIKLVCTGAPGTRLEQLRALARGLDLGGHVSFPGYLEDAELAALIAQAAGLVFPSLYEGFGLPVIEAMAVGVPVAASRAAALSEVAGDAAYLFDPVRTEEIAEAMLLLTRDEVLRSRLIQAGPRRARDFSDARAMALEYWALFLEAMGGACTEWNINDSKGSRV